MSRRIKCGYCESEFNEEWIEHELNHHRCPVCESEGYMFDTKTFEDVYLDD